MLQDLESLCHLDLGRSKQAKAQAGRCEDGLWRGRARRTRGCFAGQGQCTRVLRRGAAHAPTRARTRGEVTRTRRRLCGGLWRVMEVCHASASARSHARRQGACTREVHLEHILPAALARGQLGANVVCGCQTPCWGIALPDEVAWGPGV